MKTKLMMIGALAAICTAHELAAMPTRAETARAEPAVRRLMASDHAALNSGKMTHSEVADAAMKHADEAAPEAEKLLLMKGAFSLYVRAGEYDRAIETIEKMQAAIPDMPDENVISIIKSSLRNVSRDEARELYAFLDDIKAGCRNADGSANGAANYKFNYKLDNNGNAILTGMPCVSPKPEGVLIVPSIIEGHKVTKLDEHLSFVNCDKMTKIILPAGLESVGFGNFLKGCSSLADIEISKTNPNFTSFKGVLYSKDMKKVVAYPKAREKIELSPQTKIIGRGAFSSCTFKEIEVPSGIERIESHAFVAMLNLEKIVFPESVNEIWMQLFQEDSNLRKIIFVGNAPEVHIEGIYGFFAYAPENIVIEVKKGTKGWNGKDSTDIPERWPKSQFGDRDSRPIRYIGEAKAKNNGLAGANGQTATVDGYTWSYFIKNGEATVTAAVSPSPKGDITIPATLGGVKVTGLGEKIFYQCKEVTSVTIPEGVTSIGPSAFDFCLGLKSVTIPSSVKTIGNWAFSACFQLQSVTLPESLEYIGIGGFINCRSLKTVNIPAKLNEIGGAAFAYCTGLKQFTVDAENETFTAIDGALYSKDWSTLVSAPNVSTIARMPSTITKIGVSAFQGRDRLETLTIPESVTLIDCGAFHDCGRLGSMTIPAGVAKIEGGAFYNCGELTEVTMLGERPEAPNAIFNKNCGKLKSIHVPANAKSWAGMKDWFGIPLVFDAK